MSHKRQALRWRYGRRAHSAKETLGGFRVGDRVQLHPGTDRWMMGDKYGDVVRIGRSKVHVKLDRSGQTVGFRPDRLQRVD